MLSLLTKANLNYITMIYLVPSSFILFLNCYVITTSFSDNFYNSHMLQFNIAYVPIQCLYIATIPSKPHKSSSVNSIDSYVLPIWFSIQSFQLLGYLPTGIYILSIQEKKKRFKAVNISIRKLATLSKGAKLPY